MNGSRHASGLRVVSIPPQPADGDLAALLGERTRLQAEVAATRARLLAAKERAAALEAELRESLRVEVARSEAVVESMEREHDAAVTELQRAATAEADRIRNESAGSRAGRR